MSLYEFQREPRESKRGPGRVFLNLKGVHRLFSNSEPPGRGLDIKEGPESVPLLRVGGGPWTTPFVGLNETNLQMLSSKGLNGFGRVGISEVGL